MCELCDRTLSTLAATPVAARVAAGASLLDQAAPGWEDRINLDRLNIASGTQCILGQLYGMYDRGQDVLRDRGYLDQGPSLALLGFTAGYPNTGAGLKAAWKEAILARRHAKEEAARLAREAADRAWAAEVWVWEQAEAVARTRDAELELEVV
jgi:hypothetical protein